MRTCRNCGSGLRWELRSDALYCSGACSKAYRRRNGSKAPQRPATPDKARTRRRSRDGKGVRIYIAPGDSNLRILQKAHEASNR